jgi:hypothetical protein
MNEKFDQAVTDMNTNPVNFKLFAPTNGLILNLHRHLLKIRKNCSEDDVKIIDKLTQNIVLTFSKLHASPGNNPNVATLECQRLL